MTGAGDALVAYRADQRPVDADVFYATACDPQRSVVVEACAGAGKTWMLVSRILRALLDGALPHEILAITFTRKAAGEMRERLSDWLREFSAPQSTHEARVQALEMRGAPPARVDELAGQLGSLRERLLRGGRAVEVRTFHAWFAQLLRAAPLELLNELGLPREAELVEDLDEHLGEVHRRFHTALLRDPALLSDHRALIGRRGRSQARAWLDTVLHKRVEFELADAAGVLDDSVPAASALWPGLAAWAHPTQVLLSAPWQASLHDLADQLDRGGKKAIDAALGVRAALLLDDTSTLFEAVWAALFTKEGDPRKLGVVTDLDAVQGALADIATQSLQQNAHDEHQALVRLARVLLAEYASYKRQRGLVDMNDLEHGALALLRDATLSGWVQERLDARVRHVLIDEFQDTSPLQWHALHSWLSAYAGAGGGASGQRPPSVFIVGDPKQSIYRFRRAEPRVFEAAATFVVQALGGSLLACDHTRRNAPEVLAALNPVFEAAQQAGEFHGFRAHSTAVAATPGAGLWVLPPVPRPPKAARASANAPLLPWRDSLITPRHEPEEVLREQEAARVAEAIQSLVRQRQVRPADIFVLCRKRQSLRLVGAALQAHHLPFAAVEDYALLDTPEAQDLLCVLDVLASPQHNLALARVLRSPLFGASDADLIALATAARAPGASGDWWPVLMGAGLPGAVLPRAAALLQAWRVAAQQLPPHDLLDRIVGEGELRERVVATVPPEQRAAALDAIDAVLGQALTLDGARYATPYNFVRALRRRTVKVAAPAHADAVQLLTVHGAKGLEADWVFVMDSDPEARNASTATLLVDWPVDAEQPRRCAFLYSEARCPPSLQTLLDDERAARRREELNGLYVAMSRARQALVFSATVPMRRPEGSAWWQRVATLARAWPTEPESDRSASAVTAPPASLYELPPGRPVTPPSPASMPSPDSAATRLGQAVHRVLEWATAPLSEVGDLGGLADAAAREFGAPAGEVARLAGAILGSADCARFFSGTALHWAGNEVPVGEAGEVLRIDRLVALQQGDALVWWVLDYKLNHAPEQLAEHREQLARYRRAVALAQPGAEVRCAFITGAGAVVELV